MKKIIITQRFEKIGKFRELRDNLDIRLSNLIYKFGFLPILIPTNSKNILNFIKEIRPKGIILSGGGNPKIKDERFHSEKKILDYIDKKKMPVLGICRGAQRINMHFKGKLKKVKNHVRKKHSISPLQIKENFFINSFHDFGFDEKMLGKNLKTLAKSNDGVVKYFKHKSKPIFGIMWHPERNKKINNFDKSLIKKIFK